MEALSEYLQERSQECSTALLSGRWLLSTVPGVFETL